MKYSNAISFGSKLLMNGESYDTIYVSITLYREQYFLSSTTYNIPKYKPDVANIFFITNCHIKNHKLTDDQSGMLWDRSLIPDLCVIKIR